MRKIKGLSIMERLGRSFRCTITQTPAVPLHAQYAGHPSESAKKFYTVALHTLRQWQIGDRIIYLHVDENDPYRWIKQYRDVLLIDHPHIIDMLAAGYAPQECKEWQLENDAAAVPLHAATVTCFCGASMSTVNAREFTCPKNCCTITRTGRC